MGRIGTSGNWASTARIYMCHVVLGPNGGHAGQHGTAHSVIWVMSALSLRHEHRPIGSRAGSAHPELQDYPRCHNRGKAVGPYKA
jgi:hypothetical protein